MLEEKIENGPRISQIHAFYLKVALEAAKVLDDKAVWRALGEAALMQGNHQVNFFRAFHCVLLFCFFRIYRKFLHS